MTRRRPLHFVAMSALALIGSAASLQAQSNPISSFQLTDYGGELYVESEFRRDNDSLSGRQVTSQDLMLNYGLRLDASGYVYHPNLLEFTGQIDLGLTNNWTELNAMDRTSDAFLVGFNLNATLLKNKLVSGRVFGERFDRTVNRSFAQTIQLTRQSEGFEVNYHGDYPASIYFEYTQDDETSDTRLDNQSQLYTRFQIEDNVHRGYYTQLTLEHEEVQETIQSRAQNGSLGTPQDLPQSVDEVNLVNRYAWGEGLRKDTLDGQFTFRNQSGAFESTLLRINQSLNLQHTQTFSTFYTVRYRDDTSGGQSDREIGGEIGFRKSIYDSLDIVGFFFYTDDTFTDGSTSELGGELDLDYRKKTPIGQFTSSLSFSRNYQSETSAAGIRRIIDEAVTFSGAPPVSLAFPNVVTGSVVVTDTSNVVIYVEGLDYTLTTFGATVQIERLVGGSIADGQTVFVDYTVDIARDAQYTTDDIVWRMRLDLDMVPVSIYTEYRERTDTLTTGLDPGNLNSIRSLLGGVEVRPIEELTLRGEIETREDRLNLSSDSLRVRAEYHHTFEQTVTLTVNAGYETVQYRDGSSLLLLPGEDTLDTISAGATLTSRINANLIVKADGLYYQSEGRSNNTRIRGGLGLTWRKGLLSIDINGYHEYYEQEGDNGNTDFIGINVRRRF
ncbi:MAG: hypothetical protein GC164_08030 [Phycisphaera sp.]|nr:hypothetical protein [Phycisphaera sp.]